MGRRGARLRLSWASKSDPRLYAWSSPIEDSTARRFFAVLHTARINSPLEAVRAAIVAEQRAQKTD